MNDFRYFGVKKLNIISIEFKILYLQFNYIKKLYHTNNYWSKLEFGVEKN